MTTTQPINETELVRSLQNDLAQRIVSRDQALVAAEEAEKELADFKRKVLRIAMAAQARYNWCSTFDEALEELGLSRPNLQYSATLNIQVLISTTDTRRHDSNSDMPGSRTVYAQLEGINAIERHIRESLSADGNHENFQIHAITSGITDLVRVPQTS